MRLIRSRRGQSMGEYAVLIAIVLGAAVAMQHFIRMRLQGASNSALTAYGTAVSGSSSGLSTTAFEPGSRETASTSKTQAKFTSSKAGRVESVSDSATKDLVQ